MEEIDEHIARAMDIIEDGTEDETYITKVMNNLMRHYNLRFSPQYDDEHDSEVMQVLAGIASRYGFAYKKLEEDAKEYASMLHIDDSWPYSPNSIQVMGILSRDDDRAFDFLSNMVQNDYGLAKWEAVEAIAKGNNPRSPELLEELVMQNINPGGDNYVISSISHVKGLEYIDNIMSSHTHFSGN